MVSGILARLRWVTSCLCSLVGGAERLQQLQQQPPPPPRILQAFNGTYRGFLEQPQGVRREVVGQASRG